MHGLETEELLKEAKDLLEKLVIMHSYRVLMSKSRRPEDHKKETYTHELIEKVEEFLDEYDSHIRAERRDKEFLEKQFADQKKIEEIMRPKTARELEAMKMKHDKFFKRMGEEYIVDSPELHDEPVYEATVILSDEQLCDDGIWRYTFDGLDGMKSETKVVKIKGYSLDNLLEGLDMDELDSLTIREI